MRVLHTIASLNPATGGPARSVPNLGMALRREGLSVALWTPEAQDPEWLADLTTAGIEIHSGDLLDLPAYDLIHDHGVWLPNNRRVAAHAKAQHIPRIVSPRGMLEPWALNHKKWKKRLAWWLYQRGDLRSATALHATAESEAEQFRKLGFKKPIIVAANGVDGVKAETLKTETLKFKMFATEAPDHVTLEGRDPGASHLSAFQRLSISASTPRTALFLSRIHPKKGLPMLIHAWANVRPVNWRMRVVGPDEGGHRKEIAALIAKAGLGAEWTLESAVDDEAKWRCYRDADLFILPTYSENFGICVAEALASGVPVITTMGTPWAGLHEQDCGWWVPPTTQDLAAALKAATASSPEKLQAMGERGQAWMSRDFTWDAIATKMVTAYQELLG